MDIDNSKIAKKKKIMFVIPSLRGGGAERVMTNLVGHLDKDKYDILLVVFENRRYDQNNLLPSIRIVCLNKKNRWDFLKLIFKLHKAILDHNPEVVISFLLPANIITAIACMFLRIKPRLLLCVRNYPSKYFPTIRLGYYKKCLMKFTYRTADRIVAVSNSIKRELEKDFNIQATKISVIYNPLHLESVREKSKKHIENTLINDENIKVIIGVGRLVEQKRFDRLLRAFSIVKEKQEKVRLMILGNGKLQKELETLASQLNINKWVDIFGFESNPYAWMAKADLFVLSSDFEGFPNVILEAMACGVPVISADCPSGPREIITDGKNGILVPLASEDKLAEAMLTLLKNENLRERFSREGRKRAEDFRIEKILPQYEELFE